MCSGLAFCFTVYVKRQQCGSGNLSGMRVELLLSAKFRAWEQLVVKINGNTQEGDEEECEVKAESFTEGMSMAGKSNENVQKPKRGVPEPERRMACNKRPRFEPRSPDADPEPKAKNISVPSSSSSKNQKPFLMKARKLLVPKQEMIMRRMKFNDLAEEGQELALKVYISY